MELEKLYAKAKLREQGNSYVFTVPMIYIKTNRLQLNKEYQFIIEVREVEDE
jgi:hypothetical protein